MNYLRNYLKKGLLYSSIIFLTLVLIFCLDKHYNIAMPKFIHNLLFFSSISLIYGFGCAPLAFFKKKKDIKNLEYILCSAIHYDDGLLYSDQPENIKTGFVLTGRRHGDCINIIEILKGKENYDSKLVARKAQGFLTSTNRFVSRKEAYIIAKQNDQILLQYHHDKENEILISEDLY